MEDEKFLDQKASEMTVEELESAVKIKKKQEKDEK